MIILTDSLNVNRFYIYVYIVILLQRSSVTYTEEEAYGLCLEKFESKPAFHMKDNLPNVPVNVSINACANDLMVRTDMWNNYFESKQAFCFLSVRRQQNTTGKYNRTNEKRNP